MPYPFRRFLCRGFLFGSLLALIAGCAVQRSPSGQLQLAADPASLFGEQVRTLVLADGSNAVLRRYQGQYSLKLEKTTRVVYLPVSLVGVSDTYVSQANGRTTILVEGSERGCDFRYHLFSIQGYDVRTWQFGNCRDPIQIYKDGENVYYDLIEGRQVQRYVLDGSNELRRASFQTALLEYTPAKPRKPAVQQPGVPSFGQRYMPGLPIALDETDVPRASRPETAAAPERRPAQAAAPKAPTAANKLEFKPVSQEKVVVIDLKK